MEAAALSLAMGKDAKRSLLSPGAQLNDFPIKRKAPTASWAPTLGAPTPVETPDGLSFSQVELVPQAHGGSLRRGNPGNAGGGGREAAERRRARAERDEAIDDAVTGHIEKRSWAGWWRKPEASSIGARSAAVSGRR